MKPAIVTIILFLSLTGHAQDSTRVQKYYYRSELVTGSLTIAGGVACLGFAINSDHNVTSGFGIGGLAGIVLGGIVLGFGIDDRKDFLKQKKIQALSAPDRLGLVLNF